MKAILKSYHSPDVYDLINYHPEDPEKFGFLLQLMIGPKDEVGEESFDIEVCTPKWLLDNYKKDEVLVGRHHLIVFEYNLGRIIQKITRYINACEGKTWEEVAQKIGRLGKWEFEDYVPYKNSSKVKNGSPE